MTLSLGLLRRRYADPEQHRCGSAQSVYQGRHRSPRAAPEIVPVVVARVAGHYEGTLRLIDRCWNATARPAGADFPLYIVDRDVERFLPTVVVATVDKLAQLGQRDRALPTSLGASACSVAATALPFWIPSGLSVRPLRLSRARHMSECGGHAVLYPPFHDLGPALLVQDELHLLSEELRTQHSLRDGGHEAVGDARVSAVEDSGATATITHFGGGTHNSSTSRGRSSSQHLGPRRFVRSTTLRSRVRSRTSLWGARCWTEAHTTVTRVLSLVYQELQEARDRAAVDLAGACVRYGIPELSREEFERLHLLL